ncbi:MAG: hypothetical protein ACMUJM_15890 [bacterium]
MKGSAKHHLVFSLISMIICICIAAFISGCSESLEDSLEQVQQIIETSDQEAVEVSTIAAAAGLAQTSTPSDLSSIDDSAGEVPDFDMGDYNLMRKNSRALTYTNDSDPCKTITAETFLTGVSIDYVDYTIDFIGGGNSCLFSDGSIAARWYPNGNKSITFDNLTSGSCTFDGSLSTSSTTDGDNTTTTYVCEDLDVCGRPVNCTCQKTVDSNGNIVSYSCTQDNEYTIDGQTAAIDSSIEYDETNETYSGSITITYTNTANNDNIDVTFTLSDIYIDPECDRPTGGTMQISDWNLPDTCAGTKTISFEETTCENQTAIYTCGENENIISLDNLASIVNSGS